MWGVGSLFGAKDKCSWLNGYSNDRRLDARRTSEVVDGKTRATLLHFFTSNTVLVLLLLEGCAFPLSENREVYQRSP